MYHFHNRISRGFSSELHLNDANFLSKRVGRLSALDLDSLESHLIRLGLYKIVFSFAHIDSSKCFILTRQENRINCTKGDSITFDDQFMEFPSV